jgi:hypothetical protein
LFPIGSLDKLLIPIGQYCIIFWGVKAYCRAAEKSINFCGALQYVLPVNRNVLSVHEVILKQYWRVYTVILKKSSMSIIFHIRFTLNRIRNIKLIAELTKSFLSVFLQYIFVCVYCILGYNDFYIFFAKVKSPDAKFNPKTHIQKSFFVFSSRFVRVWLQCLQKFLIYVPTIFMNRKPNKSDDITLSTALCVYLTSPSL